MRELLSYVLIIILSAYVAFLIITLVDAAGCYENDTRYAKISFKSFKRFYEINPDRWSLKSSYVLCLSKHPVYNTYVCKSERFYFTFIDFIKYNRWMHSLHKIESNKSKMESTARMLALVKQDIEQFESKANAQTNQATDNLRDIINNM